MKPASVTSLCNLDMAFRHPFPLPLEAGYGLEAQKKGIQPAAYRDTWLCMAPRVVAVPSLLGEFLFRMFLTDLHFVKTCYTVP